MSRTRTFTFAMMGDEPELVICGWSLTELLEFQDMVRNDSDLKGAFLGADYVDFKTIYEEPQYGPYGQRELPGGYYLEEISHSNEPDYHTRPSADANACWEFLEWEERWQAECREYLENPCNGSGDEQMEAIYNAQWRAQEGL